MWRSSWILALAVALCPTLASSLCLPPVGGGGLRLGEAPFPPTYWLSLTLRQHELCWRGAARPDELRVAVVGNSAVYGFPLPAGQAFTTLLNERFEADGAGLRLYNLAFPGTYQFRDALTIRAALDFEPDVIVYPVVLADFRHVAPNLFKSMVYFFDVNGDRLAEMVADPPPGLEDVAERYGDVARAGQRRHGALQRLREVGAYARSAVGHQAHRAAGALAPLPPPAARPTRGRQTRYDCAAVEERFRRNFADWQRWNILAYLEQVQNERGVPVLVVHWPEAEEPVGGCFNVRYPRAAVDEFADWLAEQTRQRGLAFVDLHSMLPPTLFLDSVHVSAAGHQRIATALAPHVTALAREVRESPGRRPALAAAEP